MDVNELRFIISNSPPFNKLTGWQLNKLVNIAEFREYKSGEIIYKEGDQPDYFYLLLKVRVSVFARQGQKDIEIEIIKRGTCFGIISLLTDDFHSVTTKSIESSVILQVEKDNFKEFLKRNPLISLDFSRLLSQRVKARSKPKRIFQCKKIGIIGNDLAGKTTYMVGLGEELKQQTKKDIISIQIVSPAKDIFRDHVHRDKVLSLKYFKEESISDYLIKDVIDHLYVKLDIEGVFLSLLNLLSESYHFILYEIPQEFLEKYLDEFIDPAHQLHFLLFPKIAELKDAGLLIRELKNNNPLNQEKIKVILAEFSVEDILSFEKKKELLNHTIYATLPMHASPDYSLVLRRISREIGEVVLGIALGSGAAYGFSHIGVLKILEESNITMDIICGSSMGAVVAALWAAGFNIVDIERLAQECGRKISSFSIMGLSFPFRGIMRAKRLENIFKNIFGDLTFYDLKHTLKIVAFDFRRRKTVILDQGPLYKAVAASCAFPGIFEPIRFKKDILLDGGILNPLPTKALLNYNVNKIIASNITLSAEQAFREYSKRSRFNIFDFIFGSIETMQQQFIEEALKIADVNIHSNLEGLGLMEFDKISEFIKRGETAAKDKIKEIETLTSF